MSHHDTSIYPPDPVTEPIGDLTWFDKEHPCNGPLHWRWHVSAFLMKVEDFAGALSDRANGLRRAVDPIEGTKAQERQAAIRLQAHQELHVKLAREGDAWGIEMCEKNGLDY